MKVFICFTCLLSLDTTIDKVSSRVLALAEANYRREAFENETLDKWFFEFVSKSCSGFATRLLGQRLCLEVVNFEIAGSRLSSLSLTFIVRVELVLGTYVLSMRLTFTFASLTAVVFVGCLSPKHGHDIAFFDSCGGHTSNTLRARNQDWNSC